MIKLHLHRSFKIICQSMTHRHKPTKLKDPSLSKPKFARPC